MFGFFRRSETLKNLKQASIPDKSATQPEIFHYMDSIGFPFSHNRNCSKIWENFFSSCPQAKLFACLGGH